MQLNGLLYGSRLLAHVDFPASEVLGPDASEDQIQGMIDAVLQLDYPHHVVFISASPLALEKAEICEGPNRDLIYELYRVLSAKGCTYAFDFRAGKGKEINKLLAEHNV